MEEETTSKTCFLGGIDGGKQAAQHALKKKKTHVAVKDSLLDKQISKVVTKML